MHSTDQPDDPMSAAGGCANSEEEDVLGAATDATEARLSGADV